MYLSFLVWLVSPSILPSKSIHVLAIGKITAFFMPDLSSVLYSKITFHFLQNFFPLELITVFLIWIMYIPLITNSAPYWFISDLLYPLLTPVFCVLVWVYLHLLWKRLGGFSHFRNSRTLVLKMFIGWWFLPLHFSVLSRISVIHLLTSLDSPLIFLVSLYFVCSILSSNPSDLSFLWS